MNRGIGELAQFNNVKMDHIMHACAWSERLDDLASAIGAIWL